MKTRFYNANIYTALTEDSLVTGELHVDGNVITMSAL